MRGQLLVNGKRIGMTTMECISEGGNRTVLRIGRGSQDRGRHVLEDSDIYAGFRSIVVRGYCAVGSNRRRPVFTSFELIPGKLSFRERILGRFGGGNE